MMIFLTKSLFKILFHQEQNKTNKRKVLKIIIKNKAFESIRPGKFNINFTSNSKY
jgi:hypothetical protein